MINIATLLGRVGKKYTNPLGDGKEVTVISIATNKKYKDSQGNPHNKTTWHNVSCFSKLSDIAKKYVNVGDFVFIQGEIQNTKIISGNKEGQHIYSVIANEIKFIPTEKKEHNKIYGKPNGNSISEPNNNQNFKFYDEVPDFI